MATTSSASVSSQASRSPSGPRARTTSYSSTRPRSRSSSARVRATYVLFVHAVADIATSYLAGFADSATDGNSLGSVVSDYTLRYEGGTTATTPVLRRFAIQQSRIGWGASPFAAVPAREDQILRPVSEQLAVTGAATQSYGLSECRHVSARDSEDDDSRRPSSSGSTRSRIPHPELPLESVLVTPRDELSAVYAVTLTDLADHPLRPGVRRRVRLDLPAGAALNAIGELDDVCRRPRHRDLGPRRARLRRRPLARRRARACSRRDPRTRSSSSTSPTRRRGSTSGRPVATRRTSSRAPPAGVAVVPAAGAAGARAHRRRRDGRPVPVRLHVHGEAGEYLPPRGHHRKVNGAGSRTTTPSSPTAEHQYAYVDGECVVDLPLGDGARRDQRAATRSRRCAGTVEVDAETDELDVRARAGAALARARLGDGRHPRPLPQPADGAARGPGRGRQRGQPARQPVGRDVLATSATSTARRRSAPRSSAATASSWCASAPRTACRCWATSRCSATRAR